MVQFRHDAVDKVADGLGALFVGRPASPFWLSWMRFKISRKGTSFSFEYMVMSAKLLTLAVPGTLERFWSIMLSTTMLALPEASTLYKPGLPAMARMSVIFIEVRKYARRPAQTEGHAGSIFKGVAWPSASTSKAMCFWPLVTRRTGTFRTKLYRAAWDTASC